MAAPDQIFAASALVDARGWVLLQERDEHPVIDPGCWGFVGGGLEDGEDHEAAVYREILEETGLRLDPATLVRFGTFPVRQRHKEALDEFSLWSARTELTDADIVLGEGRQIVFVDPQQVPDLPLGAAAEVALTAFLASGLYAELTR